MRLHWLLVIIAAVWPVLVKGQFYYGTNPLEINDFNDRNSHSLQIATALGQVEITRQGEEDGFVIHTIEASGIGLRLGADPGDSLYSLSLSLPEGEGRAPYFDISGVFCVCAGDGTGRLSLSGVTPGGTPVYPTIVYSEPARGIVADTDGSYDLLARVAKPVGVFFEEEVATISLTIQVQGCDLVSLMIHEIRMYDGAADIPNPGIALGCGSTIWLGLDASASITQQEQEHIAGFAGQLLTLGLNADIQDLRASVSSYATMNTLLYPPEILTPQSLADSGSITMQLDAYRSAENKAEGELAHTGFHAFLEYVAPQAAAGDLVCIVTDGLDNSGITERGRTHFLAANLDRLIQVSRGIRTTGAHLLWILGDEPGDTALEFYFKRLSDALSATIVRPGNSGNAEGSQVDIIVQDDFALLPDVLQQIWTSDCSELILSLQVDSTTGTRTEHPLHVALTWNNPHAGEDTASLYYVHRRAGEDAQWTIIDSVRCTSPSCRYTDRYRRSEEDERGMYYISSAPSPGGQALKSNKQEFAVPGERYLYLTPNPVTEWLYVRTHPCTTCSITLYDMQGKALYSMPADRPGPVIDVSGLAPGAYCIKLDDRGNHYTQAIFFIKTN